MVVGYIACLLPVVLEGSEIFPRNLLPATQSYSVWPRHMHVVFNPNDNAELGISGRGHFIANSLGLRSDETSRDQLLTIYVFGGPTSFGVAPHWATVASYLQEAMGRSDRYNRPLRVYDFGRSGYRSTQEQIFFASADQREPAA